ncbi:MAG: hypothetical protein ACUVQW_07120 [Candidatus Bathycorpusculaceae bacterium]
MQKTAGLLLVHLPFFLSVLFLVIVAFSARKMRKIHPHLPTSSVERCPLCNEKVIREKFTGILFLFLYTFKTLRHYEKRHEHIGKYARRVRLAFNLFLLLAIHSFAAAVASRNVEAIVNPEMSLMEAAPYFIVPYFSIQLTVWAFFAYMLLWKKGRIFERKLKRID